MTGSDLFILCLSCCFLGIYLAIIAMYIGRRRGRRQAKEADRYWRLDWERPENHTEVCDRLRIPTGRWL